MKKSLTFLFATLCIVQPVANADQTIKFGVYTADKASSTVSQVRPTLNVLEQEVSKELGEKVTIEMNVASTYEEGIEAITAGKVDIAQLGPVAYVLVKEKNKDVSLLAVETEDGNKEFPGIIAVRSDSGLKSLADLKGKKFAFGDELSTTGRYLPQKFLLDNGIHSKDLSHFEYLGRHDKVGEAVVSKEFDAGSLKKRAFKKLVDKGAPLTALVTYPSITKPWVARAGLDAKVAAALKKALVGFSDAAALETLGQDGFADVTDEEFGKTREAVTDNKKFFN